MSELLKAFDSYNDFERNSYFTLSFDEIASELLLETPLEDSKENMDKVLDLLNLVEDNYRQIFKNWSTEDSCNADFTRDYPYQILFKSLKSKSLIWVSLESDTLSVEFLYDCKDSTLEKWIVEKNHLLRQTFGLSRKPKFKVLTKSNNHFDTEDVNTEDTKLNLARNYNEDFKTVHDDITKSLKTKKSGLVLLYGEPGTGKTTYIKSLISCNSDLNFIFIQNEFVKSLLDPDFISFLLRQRNSILIIEDAEKVITSREQLNEESVVSTILQLTDGLFSDFLNIKVISSFNTNLSKIDKALLRKGRMIAMYEFKPLTIAKTNELLAELGAEETNKELTVADIYNFKQISYNNIKHKKVGF